MQRKEKVEALKMLKRFLETPAGPRPAFKLTDIVRLILMLGEQEPLGRKSIAKMIRLGEGSTRTLLGRLQENGLIKIVREGCRLTEEGRKLYNLLTSLLTPPRQIDADVLKQGKQNCAVLVRGSASKIKKGLEQRDAAVRAGANGATTLIYLGERFTIPCENVDLEERYPSPLWSRLRERLKPSDGDAIIIAGADSGEDAEEGVLAAALYTVLGY